MGSSSDSRIMHGAAEILDSFSIPHEDQIISAHRTPERLNEYAKHAEKSKFKRQIATVYFGSNEFKLVSDEKKFEQILAANGV